MTEPVRSYSAALAQFIEAATARGAALERFDVPGKGPDGEALSTDVARLGSASAERLLIITSGTHGNEGLGGSAVQHDLLVGLDRLVAPHGGTLPGDCAIVLIHAVNPWGFAHHRRQTEANIDLNRNFRDWSVEAPDRPVYASLHGQLCPDTIDPSSEAMFAEMANALVAEHGMAWVQARFTEGQWQFPDGLYYGGDDAAPENKRLQSIVAAHVSGCRHALLIDVHTGMGAYGDHLLLAGVSNDSPQAAWLRNSFSPQRVVALRDQGEAHGGRWPTVDGKMTTAIQRAHRDIRIEAVTIEFGTMIGGTVFMAERREHWAWRTHGAGTPEHRRHAEALLAAMVPPDPLWHARMLDGARATITDGWRALVGEGEAR